MNLDRFGFKAKNKRTGLWECACLNMFNFGCYGVTWDISETESYYYSDIYPETLCQCTGMKDSYGNLIYENDYLHVKGMYKGEPVECEKALVKYDEAMLTWLVRLDDHSEYLKNILRQGVGAWECVVVGNKFDKEKENEP